ncbi:MAG: murein L,D-transpeptidase catalytic domain family protein [Thermoanaerobaculia bacterium]
MPISTVLIRLSFVLVAIVAAATALDSPASEQVRATPQAAVRTVLTSASVSLPAASESLPAPAPLSEILLRQAPGLHSEALELAFRAVESAASEGLVARRTLLTVIDYSIPSTEPRLFVFDVERRVLLFRELVAHGKNSGENLTTRFSNTEGSLATSLGLFVTEGTYMGGNGYSLRLNGLDRGFNDQAMSRAIVMHGAPYVNASMAKKFGRLGRSWGCPAVSPKVAKKLIDTLKHGSPVFAYYPDPKWLQSSPLLNAAGSGGATSDRELAIR